MKGVEDAEGSNPNLLVLPTCQTISTWFPVDYRLFILKMRGQNISSWGLIFIIWWKQKVALQLFLPMLGRLCRTTQNAGYIALRIFLH